jgi:hypothetical protein
MRAFNCYDFERKPPNWRNPRELKPTPTKALAKKRKLTLKYKGPQGPLLSGEWHV